MSKKIEKKKENNKDKYIIIGLACFVALIVLTVLYSFISISIMQSQYLKSEKEKALELLCIEFQDEVPVIPAGSSLSQSETDTPAMRYIPDDLRKQIIKIQGQATITVSGIDPQKVGVQPVEYRLSMKDKHGEDIKKTQQGFVEVKDTTPVDFVFKANTVVIDGSFESVNSIYDNVSSITDPLSGDYKYSEDGEINSYYIDTNNVIFSQDGEYPVTVKVNDHGVLREKDFFVVVRHGGN